jgi:hypothetical protein
MSMSMSTSIPLSCHSSLSWSLTTRAIPPKNLRALRVFVLNPARKLRPPFRDHPCQSVATPARHNPSPHHPSFTLCHPGEGFASPSILRLNYLNLVRFFANF